MEEFFFSFPDYNISSRQSIVVYNHVGIVLGDALLYQIPHFASLVRQNLCTVTRFLNTPARICVVQWSWVG